MRWLSDLGTRVRAALLCLRPEQPTPDGGTGDCWAEVIAAEQARPDCNRRLVARWTARRALGIARYGQVLARGDGRDERRDLEEEGDDYLVYAWRVGDLPLVASIRALLVERAQD